MGDVMVSACTENTIITVILGMIIDWAPSLYKVSYIRCIINTIITFNSWIKKYNLEDFVDFFSIQVLSSYQ